MPIDLVTIFIPEIRRTDLALLLFRNVSGMLTKCCGVIIAKEYSLPEIQKKTTTEGQPLYKIPISLHFVKKNKKNGNDKNVGMMLIYALPF